LNTSKSWLFISSVHWNILNVYTAFWTIRNCHKTQNLLNFLFLGWFYLLWNTKWEMKFSE
jgi:hypothetical protein